MNTVNNNAKYSFYFELLSFLRAELFDPAEARDLVDISNDYPEITLPEVTFENLSKWYESRRENEIFRTMTKHCFADLAVQMRALHVDALFVEWKFFSGLDQELFVHQRNKIDLSGKVVLASIVASDEALFARFWADPGMFLAQGDVVHFSNEEDGVINVIAA